MSLASFSWWWMSLDMIIVKKTSAMVVPTAIANRLTSLAHAIGRVPPATVMSSVATPGMSHAGTEWPASTLPRSMRLTMVKDSATVLAAPMPQMISDARALRGATTDEISSTAMVMVPKKLPAIGCRNSLCTAHGCSTALAAYAMQSTAKTTTARLPMAASISALVPNWWPAWRQARARPERPMTEANRLTGRYWMDACRGLSAGLSACVVLMLAPGGARRSMRGAH